MSSIAITKELFDDEDITAIGVGPDPPEPEPPMVTLIGVVVTKY